MRRTLLSFLLFCLPLTAAFPAATTDRQEELMRSLLDTFIGANDLPAALETTKKAEKLYPASPFWAKKSAELSLWSSDPKSALASLKRLLQLENTPELRNRIVLLAIGLKDYETALYALELNLSANDLSKADDLIYIYEQLGRPEKAAELIEKHSDRFNSPSGYAKAIELHTNMGDRLAAEKNYLTSIRKFGLTPATARGYAELLSSRQDLNAAFGILKRAEPLAKPADTAFWKMLGDLAWHYRDVKRAVKAAEILDRAMTAQEPEYDRLIAYYRSAGMDKKSENTLSKAWRKTSKPYFLLSWLGMMAKRGDYAAITSTIAGLSPEETVLASANQYFWTLKAIAAAQTGDMAAALAAYDSALEMNPGSEEIKIQLLWFLSSDLRGPRLWERLGPLSAGGAELPEKQLALAYAYLAADNSASSLEHMAAYRRLTGGNPDFRAEALEAGGFSRDAQAASFGRWLKLDRARNSGNAASGAEASDWLSLCARFCAAPRFERELRLLSSVLDRETLINSRIARAGSHGDAAETFRLGKGMKEYPAWLKLSRALTYTDTGELGQLLEHSRYTLPFRDRINALERLGLKDEARAEVARLLWKNGSDVFLNLKAQELLVPDTRSIIPSVLYRKRKALETSGAALAAHAPAGEKLSLIAGGSFFRRNEEAGGALLLKRKEDKDAWAGLAWDGRLWNTALKAGGRDAAKKFFTAGLEASRALKKGFKAEFSAGYAARADESVNLETAGLKDFFSAYLSGPLSLPYSFRAGAEASQLQSQDRIYAGRMNSLRWEISRQDRMSGWSLGSRLSCQNTFVSEAGGFKGSLDASSAFADTRFLPGSFNQYGAGLTLTRDGHRLPLRRLSPYLSTDYYYNSIFFGGFGARAGVSCSPWSGNLLEAWMEYSKGYKGSGDEIKAAGVSLSIYL